MGSKKTHLLGFAIFALAIGLLINNWDVSQAISKDIGWVFEELPEVKSVEYLDTLKKS